MSVGIKIISDNRIARHNYAITETIEAGVVLTGTEVKSLRTGKANLRDAYAVFNHHKELFLLNAHIPPYALGNRENHEPERSRKLLLKKEELERLRSRVEAQGFTLVPTKMYFKRGKVKVEIGVGKGKKLHDKRQTSKDRDIKRELDHARKQNYR